MGGSKIVLVGATSLIVGIYSLSIKRAETTYATSSMNRVRTVQVDRLAEAALRLALNDFANGYTSRSVAGKKFLGGSADYTASKHDSTYTITATVKVGAIQKTIVATVAQATSMLKKSLKAAHRGQWYVTKYYVQNS
jgi:hypothetical protein